MILCGLLISVSSWGQMQFCNERCLEIKSELTVQQAPHYTPLCCCAAVDDHLEVNHEFDLGDTVKVKGTNYKLLFWVRHDLLCLFKEK